MNELALFAGAGGGLLGTRLLGWTPVCAVEVAEYPRRVLLARQRDSSLGRFPVWDDIRTFDGRPWAGRVDVVSGGFPCQPFSNAARGRNNAVDLWPEMRRVVEEVKPRYVFAENVERKPIERAAADLHRLRYECRFTCLSASRLGAPHQRDRWWLVAHAHGDGQPRLQVDAEVAGGAEVQPVDWWKDDRSALGVRNGVADRLDRLAALGNGQVPAVVAAAWRLLNRAS